MDAIPDSNYIQAVQCMISILVACLTVGFIVMVNYEVTIRINESDERNRNRH